MDNVYSGHLVPHPKEQTTYGSCTYGLVNNDVSIMGYYVPTAPRELFVFPGREGSGKVRVIAVENGKAKIKYPAEGGIEVYYEGHKYPRKGWVRKEAVDASARVKRLVLVSIKFALRHKWMIPFLWLARKGLLRAFVDFSDNTLIPHYFKPQFFCKSAREIYRVGMKFAQTEDEEKLVWAVVMIWEFDDAYRYRAQDILGELNKEALRKSPSKEIVRIFNLGVNRENKLDENLNLLPRLDEIMIKKWKVIRKAAIFFKKYLMELDLEKIKLDEGDWYYCLQRPGFNYRGMPYKERRKIRIKIDKDL